MDYYKYECFTHTLDGWVETKPEDWNVCQYGDFSITKDSSDLSKVYIIPSVMRGGDYANSSTTQVSNHRIFLQKFGKIAGVHNLEGGYGTFAVAIRADVAEGHEGIKECLDSLESYPVIDEDDVHGLEEELISEAFDSWARHDVMKQVQEKFGQYLTKTVIERAHYKKMFLEALSDDSSIAQIESGCSVNISYDKVSDYIGEQLLVVHCSSKKLPLLIGYEWQYDYNKDLFEEKLKQGV